MAGALEIIDSVKHIINNWANTQQPLTEDASAGDTILTIRNSGRFLVGDEICLRDPINGGDYNNYIADIIDSTHVELVNPLQLNWTVDQATFLQKIYDSQMIQGIYTAEPDNIPLYPAITVNATAVDSEWLTIDSTKEEFRVDVTIFVKSATMESGYKASVKLAETIVMGLKHNVHPLVAPYETIAVEADIDASDTFIIIDDTSSLAVGNHVIIEDEWNYAENRIKKIVSDTVLEMQYPAACNFTVNDDAQLIRLYRFMYNSWPSSVAFGEIYKGTLLKAAKISWFAWEEIIWCYPPAETFLH